jgi:surface protein
MFSNATSFNQPLDAWDTSKVKTMAYMCHDATSFNHSIAGLGFKQLGILSLYSWKCFFVSTGTANSLGA